MFGELNLVQEFQNLMTPAWFAILINLLLIDVVMSWDNAILIGMATKWLEPVNRRKAILLGIALATVLRISFSFFAVFLLSVFWIKLAGGLLLLYVVWKFYKEMRTWGAHHEDIKTKATLMGAIYMIVMADFSMSLDNVLAVAGASHGNILALGIGLIASIILMAFASNIIASYLDKYPQIQWVGLLAILTVAMWMVYEGVIDINGHITQFNVLPMVVFIVGTIFVVLQQKYIPPLAEEKIQNWMHSNYMAVISGFLILSLLSIFFWDTIKAYIFSHVAILYTVLIIFLFVILEMFSLSKKAKKQHSMIEKVKSLL